MDTQWPRFQVFVQSKSGAPYMDVGSVHAPDAELALLNARDVFARRPESISMWVVPVEAILWKTSQELRQDAEFTGDAHTIQPENTANQPYHIFCKFKQAGTHEFVTTVETASASAALRQAYQSLLHRQNALSWCIIPDQAVTKSDPNEVDSLYAPALDKTFRMSTDFRTVSAMRAIKSTPNENE